LKYFLINFTKYNLVDQDLQNQPLEVDPNFDRLEVLRKTLNSDRNNLELPTKTRQKPQSVNQEIR
jgi:hypothetical protein